MNSTMKGKYKSGVPKIARGRVLRQVVVITQELLEKLEACSSQVKLFVKEFGNRSSFYRVVSPILAASYTLKGFSLYWVYRYFHATGIILNNFSVAYYFKGSAACNISQAELYNGDNVIEIIHRTGSVKLVFGPDMLFKKEEYNEEGLPPSRDEALYRDEEYVDKKIKGTANENR